MRPLSAALFALFVAACAVGDNDAPSTDGVATEDTSPAPALREDSLVEADRALRYRAHVTYPQLDGAHPALAAVNTAIADSVRAFVAAVRPVEPPPADFPFETDVEGGYETAHVSGTLYSGLLSAYAYTGGAHGNHFLLPLNYDLRTGRPIPLSALFRPGVAYRDSLAAWALPRLIDLYGRGTLFEERVPADATTLSVYTLGPDSLTLYFAPYAVAPYAAGTLYVSFGYDELRPLLDADGPLRRR
ncbi:MAG TPA: DUF4163 domain-containing protein [Rubricoccaceae bacterium]|nr:DUF4163 domain-containing protein [Rubricoccaceae bacterium]